MSNFNWSMPVLDINAQDTEQEEFDIQPRLLKRREKKVKCFYIEYDKLTRHIIEITPEQKDKPQHLRNAILVTNKIELVADIFKGRYPLSKISVVYDKNTKQHDIILNESLFEKAEFDYVFASSDDLGPVHLYCDTVLKKIIARVDYERLKSFISSDWLTEQSLERSNAQLSIFCIDSSDRTKLFDKLNINIFELCTLETVEFRCHWLPDNEEELKKFAFVHYDTDLPITFSILGKIKTNKADECHSMPQIVYKQDNKKLIIQSTMMDPNNYKINDMITFYFFDSTDPTVLYGVKKIPRAVLNNYGVLELDMRFDSHIKVVSDHLHLYIEDSDVGTDYRF